MLCTHQGNFLRILAQNGCQRLAKTARFSVLGPISGLERNPPSLIGRVHRAECLQTWCRSTGRNRLHLHAPAPLMSFSAPLARLGKMAQKNSVKTLSSSASDGLDSQNCYHDEMSKLVQSGQGIIIEIRRHDEIQEHGMMDGAHHIPLDELQAAFELPDDQFEQRYGLKRPHTDGSEIVFTCRSGRRSKIALEIAKGFGFTKARHFPGGWNSWIEKTQSKM